MGALMAGIVVLARFAALPGIDYVAQLLRDTEDTRAILQHERILITQAQAFADDSSFDSVRVTPKEVARADDPMLLQTSFEQTLATMAGGWGIELLSSTWVGIDSMGAHVGSMRVQLGGRCDFEALLGFLWTLEESAALMTVESLDVVVEQSAADSPAGMETLRWTASVAVYFDQGGGDSSRIATRASGPARTAAHAAKAGDG